MPGARACVHFERNPCLPMEIVLVYGTQSNLLPLQVKKAGRGQREGRHLLGRRGPGESVS